MRLLKLALPLLLLGFLCPAAQPQGGEIRQTTAGSSKWAVLVGVGQYQDTSINALPYAPGDAKADRRMGTSRLKELRASSPMTLALRTIDEGERSFIASGGQNA